jgi:hypothetical protein
MSAYHHSSQDQSRFSTTFARTVKVTLKTTLTNSQNRHPPPKRKLTLPVVAVTHGCHAGDEASARSRHEEYDGHAQNDGCLPESP